MAETQWGADENTWRARCGITETEIESAQWQIFANEAELKLKTEAFVFKRYEYAYKENADRFYLRQKFITDGNIDNVVDKTDITVYEIDENYSLHDISDQIDDFNAVEGWFTLKDGYPTENRSVTYSYYYCSQPLDDIRLHLVEATYHYITWKALMFIRINNTKSAITSYSLGDLSISKNFQAYDQLINEEMAKYKEKVQFLKPLYLIGMTEGRIAEWGGGMFYANRNRNIGRSRYTRYNRYY